MGICQSSATPSVPNLNQYPDQEKSLGLQHVHFLDLGRKCVKLRETRPPSKDELANIVKDFPGGLNISVQQEKALESLLSHPTFRDGGTPDIMKFLGISFLLMNGKAHEKSKVLGEVIDVNQDGKVQAPQIQKILQEQVMMAVVYIPALFTLEFFPTVSQQKRNEIHFWVKQLTGQLMNEALSIKVPDLQKKLGKEWSFLFKPDLVRRKFSSHWDGEFKGELSIETKTKKSA